MSFLPDASGSAVAEPRRRHETPFWLAELRASAGFVYVATPYTRYEHGLPAAAYDAACATAALMRHGISAFSPIAHGHHVSEAGRLEKLDVGFWERMDAPMVAAAAACVVVKMPGWQTSAGVAHEIDAFRLARKPVFYMAPGELG
ncbi:MAG: DUF1937 family protein [Xanthobacteraceae bacterium]